MTDSYKTSHWLQYPEDTKYVGSFIEARTGAQYPQVKFFGLQMFLKQYLTNRVTLEDIDEAEEIYKLHGVPFNREGWEYIVEAHDGYLPISISAIQEGLWVDKGIPLVTVRNTDPNCFWLTSYVETMLLRAIWYPTTVATISGVIKQDLRKWFAKTVDDGDIGNLDWKLHDFGARGVSSSESAAIGGLAHLTNFYGSDTVEALVYARKFYGTKMAGFSIPASEHSTITSWGKDREVDAYANMLDQFGGKGKIVACVSDSYDIYNACEKLWGEELKRKVQTSGGTLVVRPDSGDPVEVTLKVIEILGEKFGYKVNSKGYKVLPSYIRIIQGDGVERDTINAILDNYEKHGWSADNIAFGMGGALLQKVNRDTLSFVMKTSWIQTNNHEVIEVYKDPITDPGKTSKKGKVRPTYSQGVWGYTIENTWKDYAPGVFREVFRNGKVMVTDTLDTIRARG